VFQAFCTIMAVEHFSCERQKARAKRRNATLYR
jgi:hypothetical protein